MGPTCSRWSRQGKTDHQGWSIQRYLSWINRLFLPLIGVLNSNSQRIPRPDLSGLHGIFNGKIRKKRVLLVKPHLDNL
jgi:hypothetical protein